MEGACEGSAGAQRVHTRASPELIVFLVSGVPAVPRCFDAHRQKQSSMWFQANAMNTWLERNVHFNGPVCTPVVQTHETRGRGGGKGHVSGSTALCLGLSMGWVPCVRYRRRRPITHTLVLPSLRRPRAGLNFNDAMGGGDIIEGNLLTNCVRESGDHG